MHEQPAWDHIPAKHEAVWSSAHGLPAEVASAWRCLGGEIRTQDPDSDWRVSAVKVGTAGDGSLGLRQPFFTPYLMELARKDMGSVSLPIARCYYWRSVSSGLCTSAANTKSPEGRDVSVTGAAEKRRRGTGHASPGRSLVTALVPQHRTAVGAHLSLLCCPWGSNRIAG